MSTSAFATKLLPAIKLTLRETGAEFDEEIKSYIDAAAQNLQIAGILPSFFDYTQDCDPQILQAIRLYCLTQFGLYNTDSEKYDRSYQSMKALLCTNRYYTEESTDGV